jgi:hypothetical protein
LGFNPVSALTKIQAKALAQICRTNGGGLRVRCRVMDSGEVVPLGATLRKLYDLGLIQGKAGAYETVVHTRDGWRLNAELTASDRALNRGYLS